MAYLWDLDFLFPFVTSINPFLLEFSMGFFRFGIAPRPFTFTLMESEFVLSADKEEGDRDESSEDVWLAKLFVSSGGGILNDKFLVFLMFPFCCGFKAPSGS